jgi:chromosome segregation ATPase
MAKPTSDTETIESLLEQRAQYEQWLTKLDAAANKAPAAVRQKVRGDYEARLRGVIERLRGHATTITGELERYQGSQTDLDQQRRQAEEELAEAEVRYAVGEYTETNGSS